MEDYAHYIKRIYAPEVRSTVLSRGAGLQAELVEAVRIVEEATGRKHYPQLAALVQTISGKETGPEDLRKRVAAFEDAEFREAEASPVEGGDTIEVLLPRKDIIAEKPSRGNQTRLAFHWGNFLKRSMMQWRNLFKRRALAVTQFSIFLRRGKTLAMIQWRNFLKRSKHAVMQWRNLLKHSTLAVTHLAWAEC